VAKRVAIITIFATTMKPIITADDWLPLLLRILDLLARPTPYNILQGFESWEYANRPRPQLRQLKRARLLKHSGSSRSQTLHVTPAGRLADCGGIDPVRRWQRSWDGRWRLLMFDLPSHRQTLRLRLWRWLRQSRLGYLQHSVWVSPDPVTSETVPLRQLKLTPESFLVVEGRPTGADTDLDLVRGAWDFTEINRRYQQVCDSAGRGLGMARSGNFKPAEFRCWLADDRAAWLAAIILDPFLPEALLPPDYLGREAWKQRNIALAALARRSLVGQNV
jgi:phenylacetic acid degradation operon negative regulatory protein